MPRTDRYLRYVSSTPTIPAVPKSGMGRMVTEVTEVTDMSYVTDLGYVLGSAINLPIQALVVGFLSHFVHGACEPRPSHGVPRHAETGWHVSCGNGRNGHFHPDFLV